MKRLAAAAAEKRKNPHLIQGEFFLLVLPFNHVFLVSSNVGVWMDFEKNKKADRILENFARIL